MPMERISVALKPDGFFDRNPALDVPPSNQAFNKSALVSNPAGAKANVSSGAGCCADKLSTKL